MIVLQSPTDTEVIAIGTLVFVLLGLLVLFGYLLYRLLAETPDADEPDRPGISRGMRRAIDIVVAISLVLVGVGGAVLGGLLVSLADRDLILELVEEETIEGDFLTEAELVDLVYTGLIWGGAGVILAGIVLVIGGIVGIGYRRRLDQRIEADEEQATPSLASNALVGAVVTVVVSFVPFSSLVGGAVAGYLQQDDARAGFRAGIVTGLFLALPVTLIFGVLLTGIIIEGFVTVSLIILMSIIVSLIFTIIMTSLGGYIGGYLATDQGTSRARRRGQGPPGGRSGPPSRDRGPRGRRPSQPPERDTRQGDRGPRSETSRHAESEGQGGDQSMSHSGPRPPREEGPQDDGPAEDSSR